ncbi:ATP-binding protein [Spirosoma sp. KCTC 42546]|uniref:ATP-binding protein n=1 Tax=Spirosoma sp. KCTC 42546 TaxID=2520506 RepID=UPI001FEFF46F|nr:ATP-binding protein [Spirosoma sp. KCTC 42546]
MRSSSHPPIQGTSGYVYTWADIRATDNGVGIEPEVQQLIFEKFYQATSQTVRKPKGSGLGLAISKK